MISQQNIPYPNVPEIEKPIKLMTDAELNEKIDLLKKKIGEEIEIREHLLKQLHELREMRKERINAEDHIKIQQLEDQLKQLNV